MQKYPNSCEPNWTVTRRLAMHYGCCIWADIQQGPSNLQKADWYFDGTKERKAVHCGTRRSCMRRGKSLLDSEAISVPLNPSPFWDASHCGVQPKSPLLHIDLQNRAWKSYLDPGMKRDFWKANSRHAPWEIKSVKRKISMIRMSRNLPHNLRSGSEACSHRQPIMCEIHLRK